MPASPPPPLEPEKLTWAALLGRWVDFARTAIGLPADTAGRRMRESVPDIIMLQAVWFSLGELGGLDAAQRAVGLDRAGVLIEKHAHALRERWGAEPLPSRLAELIDDAAARLAEHVADRGESSSTANPVP